MNSNNCSDETPLDFVADVPTTSDDVAALQRLRQQTPSWLEMAPEDVEALLPSDGLDRRPPTAATATPFELP